MTDLLDDWEREEFARTAEEIEAQGPRKYVYRTKHRGGPKIVGGEEMAQCISELAPLKADFEKAQLAFYESINKWSKVIAVEDVAAFANISSRKDVYLIIRKLPRLRREAKKNGL